MQQQVITCICEKAMNIHELNLLPSMWVELWPADLENLLKILAKEAISKSKGVVPLSPPYTFTTEEYPLHKALKNIMPCRGSTLA